jgi:NAD(P)-dependent dehydrogenase (short-subunit alcohol dehydrogenase family)
VTFSPADMSKPVAIREMIEKTLQTSGRLDIPVNNAGIQDVAPLQDFPPEKWDAILASICHRPFIPLGWRFLRCSRTSGAASSISRRRSARQFHA